MNDSAHLRTIAERVAAAAVRHTQPRAILLAGSVPRGDADRYSDIDLILYYDDVPSADARAAVQADVGGDKWRLIGEGGSGLAEQYEVAGVTCQLGHLGIEAFEDEIEQALSGEETDVPLAKVVGGSHEGAALHGEELIESWRERTRYPDALRRTLVERHWKQIFPLWYFDRAMDTRDGELWCREMLINGGFDLLAVLAALNGVWFARFQLKRMGDLVARLPIAPANLAERLERLASAERHAATAELESLVAETQQLVHQHLPDADVSLTVAPGARQQPWQTA